MAEAHVLPPSLPPTLDEIEDAADRITAMRNWFLANYDDPANSLPYESKEGGYQWIWGGPYDAAEEIGEAFPDIDEDEKSAAVDSVQDDGVYEWTVASRRIVSPDPDEGRDEQDYDPDFDPEVDTHRKRRLPPPSDRRAYSIVETILFPRRAYNWSLHATFIPGETNVPLGEEFNGDDSAVLGSGDLGVGAYGSDRREFRSLRALVAALIDLEIEGTRVGTLQELEDSRDWIEHLPFDSDLFVDDAIVVHSSPADWFPIAKLFADSGSVSAIVLSSSSVGQAAGLIVAYGGARIVLRLFHNINHLQDAFAERMGNRIRRGDFDNGKKEHSSKKRVR